MFLRAHLRSVIALLVFWGIALAVACNDTPPTDNSQNSCPAPALSDTDTLHGVYTWTYHMPVRDSVLSQESIFLFRTNSKFFIRPDLSVANPARYFMDAGADVSFSADSMYLTNLQLNPANGGSPNVPFGAFAYRCIGDSMVFTGGASADTVMRITFPIP